MYNPSPIDTSDIILSDEIMALAELLAKNTHEVWAKTRITDGWKFGKKRDDNLKETPCLVAYEELSEEEKQYDRNTALETLRLITKLGYKISKE
ncbi:MAG: Ryanodine receptor Ryr [Clostridia bacterium]|nr:Ryanodine receptor Ryr [Clostridia bacterium]